MFELSTPPDAAAGVPGFGAGRQITRESGSGEGPSGAGAAGATRSGAAGAHEHRPGVGRPGAASVVARLSAVVEELVDLASSTHCAERWSGVERARVLALLDRLPALATSVRAPVLVAQQSAASDAGAAREFADLRARTIGGTRGQADLQVDTARTLTRLAGVREAVLDRQVLEPHVEVLAKVLRTAGPALGAFLSSAQGQAQVVELAHGSDARQFSRDLAVLAAAHDPASFEDEREAVRRARFLHLTHASDGTFLRGRLDPLAGSALQAALDATGHRPDDDRAPEQARADALAALARHALGGPASRGPGTREPAGVAPDARSTDAPSSASRASAVSLASDDAAGRGPGGDVERGVDDEGEVDDGVVVATPGVVPQISLLVPAETWYAVRRRAQQQRGRAHQGVGDDQSSDHRYAPATSEDGKVVSASELAAALCDCVMTRVVMSAQEVPLDVGRTKRMFTPAQRKAVVARDRVCAWNGCSVPPAYCQVHHIAWWHRDGGRTDLANAVLLCDFHHHEVHRLDLGITREPAPAPAFVRPEHLAVGTGVDAAVGTGPGPGTAATTAGSRPRGRVERPRYTFRDRLGRTRNAPAPTRPMSTTTPVRT